MPVENQGSKFVINTLPDLSWMRRLRGLEDPTAGLERLIRYCARGPFAPDQILYLLQEPDPAGLSGPRAP